MSGRNAPDIIYMEFFNYSHRQIRKIQQCK